MSIDSLRLPKSRNRAFLEGLGSGLVLGEAERRLILVLSDSVVVCLSCLASFALFEVDARSLVLVWLLTSLAALYSADQYSLEPHRGRAILGAVFAGSLMSLVVARAFLFPLLVYPALLVAVIPAGLGLLGSRNLWLDLLSMASQRMLLLCEGAEAQEACEEICRHPLSGFQAFGSMKDARELPETLRSWRIDCV
nr:hypothetical protein [Cyanobacteria bacterium UBA8530]